MFVPKLFPTADCARKLWNGTALRVRRERFDDFDTQAGKRSIDSEGWLEIDREVWRRSFVSGLLLDSQSKNGVLMVEAFHLEIVHVIEFHRCKGMLRRDVVTLLVNVIRSGGSV